MFSSNQKGISLILAVIVLSVILAIVLGLTTILVTQIRIVRGMGNSVVAFYAADTGIEQALKVIADGIVNDHYPSLSLDNGAAYEIGIACCDFSEHPDYCEFDPAVRQCNIIDTDSDWPQTDKDCDATRYCIRSVGTYQGVKRAIKVRVYPPSLTP